MAVKTENFAIVLKHEDRGMGNPARVFDGLVDAPTYQKTYQQNQQGKYSFTKDCQHTPISALSGRILNRHGKSFRLNHDYHDENERYLTNKSKTFEGAIKAGEPVILYIEPEKGGHTSHDAPLKTGGSKSMHAFVRVHQKGYVVVPAKSIQDLRDTTNAVREVLHDNPEARNQQLHICFMGVVARVTELDITHDSTLDDIIEKLKEQAQHQHGRVGITIPANDEDESKGQGWKHGVGYI